MRISFIHLRRFVFGTSCAVVFGFGATQALGSPTPATFSTCSEEGQQQCNDICRRTWGGPGSCTGEWKGTGGKLMVDCECSISVE